MKIHALWCHPRSMSTAIERIMLERGDLDIPHEPFMYHYYLGSGRGTFPGFDPLPGMPTTYEGIRDMIRDRSTAQPVFFKDMAYYIADELTGDPEFAGEMTHSFLIRDPAEAVISYSRKQSDFSLEEVGIEAQWRLYKALLDLGQRPLILKSEDIREDPAKQMARLWSHQDLSGAPHALSWSPETPKSWTTVAHWHPEVTASRGIKPPEKRHGTVKELVELGAPFTDYVAHHRPFYEKLVAAAEHQK
ncbi:MAG: hypothetical protein AAF393_17220 [Pseudomonadota bacterium]